MLLDKWILQFTRQPGSSHDERFIESVDVLNKKTLQPALPCNDLMSINTIG